jgi:glycosyltransferase involved in cell wall biosynthesis
MSTRPKILMVTTQLGYGGAETSFIRLANYLSQTMDVTVAIFTRIGTYSANHEPLSAPVVVLDSWAFGRWLRRILKVRALKKKHDACISFLSGPNLVNVLAGYNERSIVSLRGSRLYDPVAPFIPHHIFAYILDPIIFRLAAWIVPVSAGIKNEIRKVSGTRTLTKIHTISPFVDGAILAKRLAEPLAEPYTTLKGQKVIVAVGRLSVEKGFQHLIRVFSVLAKAHVGAKLLLIGDGPLGDELKAFCTKIGLAIDNFTPGVSSVIFAGYQKNPLPFLSVGRVYAMSSATEGFPNVLLEAMAAGLPVLAADTPWGARAILSDDVATTKPYPTTAPTETPYGVLMPRIDLEEYEGIWAEALSDHLSKPISDAAKRRVEDFDLAKVAEKWKKLIESLMAS